uniref:Family with sequence similarity 227 member B n=1 Tax=Xenopus tropicalis TaxID=8364 RepID=A0A6I8SJW8_XENTR
MHKIPSTVEEFLELQHLKDWPENPIESNKGEDLLSTIYTLDSLNEDFLKNAPLETKTFEDLEARVAEQAFLLEKYVCKILPSSEDDLHPLAETFLTEIDIPGVCETKTKKGETQVLKGISDKEKERNVENCVLTIFKSNECIKLPGCVEAAQILNLVTKAQNIKGDNLKAMKKFFLSEASVAVLQDSFWWFLCQQFKPDHVDQNYLFDRISASFTNLFWSVPHNVKDFFFKIYPDCLSQAIFAVFYEAFPESRVLFNDKFKSEVMDLIFQWVSGVKPAPCSWAHWDLSLLERTNLNVDKIHNNLTKNDETHKSLQKNGEWQLNFNLDDLIQKARETYHSSVHEVKDVHATESHCIGPGPEFHHVLFKLGGHSPLISNYLKMHKLPGCEEEGQNHKVKHVEISQLPYPFCVGENQILIKCL